MTVLKRLKYSNMETNTNCLYKLFPINRNWFYDNESAWTNFV
jgi:hypothetical protein